MPNDTVSGKTTSDIENVDWSVGTGHLPAGVRFGSSSSQTSQNSADICRICHCESDPLNPLLTPCYCSGSLKFVHQACLQQWLTASETNSCELCKFPFIMHTKIKPFNEWRSLDMSGVERRRLFCAVLFHCAAALCVIWSLCVLIERAAEEVKRGQIGWPFWTKLVVVTVGLTGGVVFMYIQCSNYLHLCNRWRARNRILLIQNAPEKFHPPQSPVLHTRIIPRYSGRPSITGVVMSNNVNSNLMNTNNMHQQSTSSFGRPQSHGQIIANIESNTIHYERDWTLDDVSQVSFKPCPQGSGSLTPFHDSVHNMYENQTRFKSGDTSNGSHESITDSNIFNEINSSSKNMYNNSNSSNNLLQPKPTNDLNLFKLGSEQLVYPTSAVFLENRDILNDNSIPTYSKLYHRHSAIVMTPDMSDNLDKFLGKDIRRYSDTKLLQNCNKSNSKLVSNSSNQIFNVTNILGPTILPIENPTNLNTNKPQITDIIFERSDQSNFDQLELNIQEILELDIQKQNDRKNSHLSLNNHNLTTFSTNYIFGGVDNCSESSGYYNLSTSSSFVEKNSKNIFKSLPNLNASNENLLQ